MDVKIEQSWKEHLNQEFEKPYFSKLIRFNAFKSTIKLLGKIQIELILDNEKRFNLR